MRLRPCPARPPDMARRVPDDQERAGHVRVEVAPPRRERQRLGPGPRRGALCGRWQRFLLWRQAALAPNVGALTPVSSRRRSTVRPSGDLPCPTCPYPSSCQSESRVRLTGCSLSTSHAKIPGWWSLIEIYCSETLYSGPRVFERGLGRDRRCLVRRSSMYGLVS